MNSLSLQNALAKASDALVPIDGLSKMDIDGWRQMHEQERYKDKPFGANYRLLELVQKEDPEGTPAKIKQMIDNLPAGQVREISLRNIYEECVEGENVDTGQLRERVREYKGIAEMFIDEGDKRTQFDALGNIEDATVLTPDFVEKKLDEIFRRNERLYAIEAGGVLFYIKASEPEIYGTGYSLDIRYNDGNFVKRVVIDLTLEKIDKSMMRNNTYSIRTKSSTELPSAYGSQRIRNWKEGDTDSVISQYEKEIGDAERSLERARKRPAQTGMEEWERALEKAKESLNELRKNQELVENQ